MNMTANRADADATAPRGHIHNVSGGRFLNASRIKKRPFRICCERQRSQHNDRDEPSCLFHASGRKTKPILDLSCIKRKRFPQQGRRNPLGRHLEHFIELMAAHSRSLVADCGNADPCDEQMHQEVLSLDRIISQVRENAAVVVWESDVIDSEFGEHNFCRARSFSEAMRLETWSTSPSGSRSLQA